MRSVSDARLGDPQSALDSTPGCDLAARNYLASLKRDARVPLRANPSAQVAVRSTDRHGTAALPMSGDVQTGRAHSLNATSGWNSLSWGPAANLPIMALHFHVSGRVAVNGPSRTVSSVERSRATSVELTFRHVADP